MTFGTDILQRVLEKVQSMSVDDYKKLNESVAGEERLEVILEPTGTRMAEALLWMESEALNQYVAAKWSEGTVQNLASHGFDFELKTPAQKSEFDSYAWSMFELCQQESGPHGTVRPYEKQWADRLGGKCFPISTERAYSLDPSYPMAA
ncbi:MAG: hypothetical protein NTZ35_01910 [Ignavibacteriales bacterium]|nr:hypothetical protein [Ignavibacteriales bacterium]